MLALNELKIIFGKKKNCHVSQMAIRESYRWIFICERITRGVSKFAHKCKVTYYKLHLIMCLIESITWILQNEKVNDQRGI
jgi:hypothetical protein